MRKSPKRKTTSEKTTRQGNGRFTKRPAPGGERFLDGHRDGSPPSRARRRKKPSRGQGK